jgi:hypothetical protein
MEYSEPEDIFKSTNTFDQQAQIVEDGLKLARQRLRITHGQLAAQGFSEAEIDFKLSVLYGPTKLPPDNPTESF